MATTNVFQEVFAKTLVKDIPLAKGHVVTIKSNQSPYEGFKTLIANNILSAPVFDLESKKYTGFLDMRDLVSFVVFIYDDQVSDNPNDLQTILTKGLKLFKVPVDGVTCTYLSRRNVFKPVSLNDNLWTVVQSLSTGVHRVPVLDDKGDVVNIISQSSIIQYIHNHFHEFEPHILKSIKDVHIGSENVIAVSKDKKAIEVFRIMEKKKLSGVAVIDETGKLVGNTSSSDLKLFVKDPNIETLKQPIMQFLNRLRQESIGEVVIPTISCSSTSSIKFVIEKLKATKVHRVFIADDDSGFVPLRVVSLTDILRYMVKA